MQYCNCKDAFVDPLFGASRAGTSIRSYIRMFPDNPELILAPLHVMDSHWTLLSIITERNTATYFDTLPIAHTERIFGDDEIALADRYIRSLQDEFYIENNTDLIFAPPSAYNAQVGGVNCAPHIIVIGEHIAIHGYSVSFQNLNMAEERKRITWTLHRLYNRNRMPECFGSSLPIWPSIPDRTSFPLDSQIQDVL